MSKAANIQLSYVEAIRLFNYDPTSGRLEWAMDTVRARKGEQVGKDIRLAGLSYSAHRIIWLLMTGKFPRFLIDHINGDHQDNRWNNLREATHQQNQFNKEGFGKYPKGVVLKKDAGRSKPWSARIRIDGKKVAIGSYATMEEAAQAYKEMAEKVQGKFASHLSRR